MTLKDFENEYCKTNVTLSGVCFTIGKLPAIKGAFIFTGLVKKLFGDIASIEISNNNGDNFKSILMGLVSGLDTEYLENDLAPMLFRYMSYSCEAKNLRNLNFNDLKVSVEDVLGFDDVLELILRGLCVNFFSAISKRVTTLVMK